MPQTAVIIPAYNEGSTVGAVIDAYRQALPTSAIYVFDNNSTDATAEEAGRHGATVIPEYRQGKGNVLRSAFRHIEADCYLMVDGDDTYPPDKAQEMVRLVLEGKADMVIGDRLSTDYFTENKRAFHNFGNRLVRWAVNAFWRRHGAAVSDVMTGLRTFSPLFVKTFPVLSPGYEVETEMTIHALENNLLVRSVPVPYRDRAEGSVSKLHTVRDGIRILRTIARMLRDYKPLSFFGGLGVVSLLMSLLSFLPVFGEYLTTGLVPRMPTLLVSVAFFLAGVHSVAIGLILERIHRGQRQLQEIAMTAMYRSLKG